MSATTRARAWWTNRCLRKANACLSVEERALSRIATGEQGRVELVAAVYGLWAEIWMALSGDPEMRPELLRQLGRMP